MGLIEALVSLGKPVFAIGGVTPERARQVQRGGRMGSGGDPGVVGSAEAC